MASMPKQATTPRLEGDVPSKGTLFCPNCSHQSQYDGDWTVVTSGQGSRSLCPDCGTEITSRSSPETGRSLFYNHVLWQMWGTNIQLLQKLFWV